MRAGGGGHTGRARQEEEEEVGRVGSRVRRQSRKGEGRGRSRPSKRLLHDRPK